MKEKIKSFILNICEDRKSALSLPSLFVALFLCLILGGCGNDGVLIGTVEGEAAESVVESGEVTERTVESGEAAESNPESEVNGEDATEDEGAGPKDEGACPENDTNVIVHMCGRVETSGVYELPAGSRIIDGVEAAGGFAENACPEAVNLSSVLQDSQRIYIPSVEETEGMSLYNATLPANAGEKSENASGTAVGGEMAGNSMGAAGKININTADESTLTLLTGIGETRAKSIIKYRENHGGFKRIEDIMNVSGIGEASFEKMKDMITVD